MTETPKPADFVLDDPNAVARAAAQAMSNCADRLIQQACVAIGNGKSKAAHDLNGKARKFIIAGARCEEASRR